MKKKKIKIINTVKPVLVYSTVNIPKGNIKVKIKK